MRQTWDTLLSCHSVQSLAWPLPLWVPSAEGDRTGRPPASCEAISSFLALCSHHLLLSPYPSLSCSKAPALQLSHITVNDCHC